MNKRDRLGSGDHRGETIDDLHDGPRDLQEAVRVGREWWYAKRDRIAGGRMDIHLHIGWGLAFDRTEHCTLLHIHGFDGPINHSHIWGIRNLKKGGVCDGEEQHPMLVRIIQFAQDGQSSEFSGVGEWLPGTNCVVKALVNAYQASYRCVPFGRSVADRPLGLTIAATAREDLSEMIQCAPDVVSCISELKGDMGRGFLPHVDQDSPPMLTVTVWDDHVRCQIEEREQFGIDLVQVLPCSPYLPACTLQGIDHAATL